MNFEGMTLNERLYLTGKLEAFEKARQKKDETKLREILRSVNVDDEELINQLITS